MLMKCQLFKTASVSAKGIQQPTLSYPANCSDPTAPRYGVIETYQSTLEGAEIFFNCNPGFIPAGRTRAVCGADGRWNPDPADRRCTGEIIKIYLLTYSNEEWSHICLTVLDRPLLCKVFYVCSCDLIVINLKVSCFNTLLIVLAIYTITELE